MKTYRDLNLKNIRIKYDIDFAHFTYKKNMCTCCSTPLEFPKRYWKNSIIPESMNGVSYILFKNADNGSGIVTRNDTIADYTCISWSESLKDKLKQICIDLMKQLDEDYFILVPKDNNYTIIIRTFADYIEYYQLASFKLIPDDKQKFDIITWESINDDQG